jgi:hypothetical protein
MYVVWNYTDKKENEIFLIYKEIQMGSVAKSYMRNGFLILYMRKCANISPYRRRPLVIYDFAIDPFWFPFIWGKFDFLFYQCTLTVTNLVYTTFFNKKF